MASEKLNKLNEMVRVVTGMSIEEIATLPHEEQMRRIETHVQPTDQFQEAVEEILRDKESNNA